MGNEADTTFCFTDIAASTRALRTLGEARYDELLERHRALIRTALADVGGNEVKTEGDGFFVTFADPSDGLRFAVGAQRALAAATWPAPVRVRIGLHRGPAVVRPDGDYSALAAHQAARVTTAAHGGQVLLTSAVAAGAVVPDGCRLVHLGAHRLRDFDGAVELLQLAGPGLADAFPPVRATREDHGLPLPRSSLVGRDEELDLLRDLLGAAPLITLHGPGGVGKTRLALEAAAAGAGSFPDGMHLVELSSLTDGSLLLATISAAVGARPLPGQDPLDALLARLGVGHQLLVLDSCERVLDQAAPLVERIVRSCPGCCVIATTTEPIRIAEERVVPVPPLPAPDEDADPATALDNDAVRLLLQRATASGAALGDGLDAAPALATMARRLDGIPLALELVAGRISELGVDAVLSGLDDRFALLTNGWRTALPRHRTLEAMVEWTVQLLEPRELDVLLRVGALRGRWRPDEAADVCDVDGEEQGVAVLQRLVDRSLLSLDGDAPPRIRLSDTVRAYLDRLRPAALEDELRTRKRQWLDRRLRALRSEGDDVMRTEIDALIADVRDVLASAEAGRADDPAGIAGLAAMVSPWYESKGLWYEAMRWLRAAIDAAPPGPARANATVMLAQHHSLIGEQSTATELGIAVLEDGHANDEARAMAHLVSTPPTAAAEGGLDPLREALRLAGSPTSAVALAARTRIGLRAALAGDLDGAVGEWREVIRLAAEHGRTALHAQALVNLGGMLIRAGQLDEGQALLSEGRELCERANLRHLAAVALSGLSTLALHRGDPALALSFAERRLEISQEMGDGRGAASALSALAGAALGAGDRERARSYNEKAVDAFRTLGLVDGLATSLFNLVVLAEGDGDLPGAASLAANLAHEVVGSGNPALQTLALLASGALGCRAGMVAGAELLGAADALRPPILPLDPSDSTWLAECEAALVVDIGRAEVDAARARGAAGSMPDALASAIAVARGVAGE